MSLTRRAESKKEGPFGPSRMLADHEVFLADFFELLEEHAQALDQPTVFSECQGDLPFAPEAQQAAGCVWSYVIEPEAQVRFSFREVFFSHDVFCFLPKLTRRPNHAEGGGPVKGYLKAGQKCLFATQWFKATR